MPTINRVLIAALLVAFFCCGLALAADVETPPAAAAQPKEAPAAPAKGVKVADPAVKIEVFGTSWCPACKAAERYLRQSGARFVVYDVENNSAAAKRFKKLGGRGVPLILVGSKKIMGFSPYAVQQAVEQERAKAKPAQPHHS